MIDQSELINDNTVPFLGFTYAGYYIQLSDIETSIIHTSLCGVCCLIEVHEQTYLRYTTGDYVF